MSPTTSRRDPVRFPRGALFGASWFGVCHAAAILGPLASIRVRVAHARASDTAVTNDIVEPGIVAGAGGCISSSRERDEDGASIVESDEAAGHVGPGTTLDRSVSWLTGIRIVAPTCSST